MIYARIKTLKKTVRALLNRLTKNESIKKSKKKWNSLAKKNARYVVLTNYGEEIDEALFRDEGKSDYTRLVKNDEILKSLLPWSKKTLLEIGCGIGRITEFLSADFNEIHGIDISEEMIQKGRKRLKKFNNVHLHATDGEYFPIPSSSIDIVFSFITFQHMPSLTTIKRNIDEIGRVLKKGGIAKIQLRGEPAKKGVWYYGTSVSSRQIKKIIRKSQLELLKTQDEGERYFWVWLRKV